MKTNKNLQLNLVKKRLLILSPTVKEGLERECNKEDFEALDERALGKGGFGQVWKVKNKHTDKVYAIKVINKQFILKENMSDQINREIEIMYRTNHPHIIKLYNHYEDDDNFYLILELASKGQLYNLLKKLKRLDEKTVAQIMRETISAVKYLHSLNPPIIHRDIKPENILLDYENRAKLADFGWSNFLENNKTRDTLAGTPEYLAPEMVMKSGHDEGVDIWSIGVLIFELLAGRPPFEFKGDINKLYSDIRNLRIKWTDDFSILAKDLVSKILRFKSSDRISLNNILNHPWFKETPLIRPMAIGNNINIEESKKYKFYLMTKVVDSNNRIYNNSNKLMKIDSQKELKKINKSNSNSKLNALNSSNNSDSSSNNLNNYQKLKNKDDIKNIIKKRKSIKDKANIEALKNETNYLLGELEINKLSNELSLKIEENNILKEEINKLKKELSNEKAIIISNQSKELNINKENETYLKLRDQEKEAFLNEIDTKTKKLLDVESKLSILKTDYNQLNREFNEKLSIIESLNNKKDILEKDKIELKEKLKTLEEEKQKEMINYEKQIRMFELKSIDSLNNSGNNFNKNNQNIQEENNTSSINKMYEMINNYMIDISISIKDKYSKLEDKISKKENTDINARNELSNSIDVKLQNLAMSFKESYTLAISEEIKLLKAILNEEGIAVNMNNNDSINYNNLEWYKNQLNDLNHYKKEYVNLSQKIESNEAIISNIKERLDVVEYRNHTLEKLNINLKELYEKSDKIKNKYQNAFLESEKLFDKYSNGKKLREMLNFHNILDE